jgi:RNA polymerase sigma-70 factor (ECF subfamily)
MPEQRAFSQVLRALAHLPGAEDWLAATIDSCHTMFPAVHVPNAVFASYLLERVPPSPGERELRSWRADELYLCCACALNDPEALAAFQAQYRPVMAATLRRLSLSGDIVEELLQNLTVQLFTPEGDRPPMITRFSGLGSLKAWLRVVTARTAGKLLQRERRLVPSSDERIEEDLLAHSPSHPELTHLRGSYRPAFERAFREAMASLTPRQVNLLRHRFVDGLTVAEIGAIYRVHHSTASRWISEVRELLLERTRATLQQELQISASECRSIINLVRSQLDLTLSSFFAGVEPVSTGED